MVESPSEYSKKEKVSKLEKALGISKGQRSKYSKDFANFIDKRNKKFKRISIILWGYLILAVVLDQFMKLQLPTLLLLPAICIPAGYILFHVTLIEYCRGNVEWSNYIWGALLSLCLFGAVIWIQWFFMTDEQTRLRYYIDYRKSNSKTDKIIQKKGILAARWNEMSDGDKVIMKWFVIPFLFVLPVVVLLWYFITGGGAVN